MDALALSALLALRGTRWNNVGGFLWPGLKGDIAYLRRGYLSFRSPSHLSINLICRERVLSTKEGPIQHPESLLEARSLRNTVSNLCHETHSHSSKSKGHWTAQKGESRFLSGF